MPHDPDPRHVRPATSADRETIARTLAAAFYTDPLARWVFPSDSHRLEALRRLHDLDLGSYMRDGLVFTTDDGGAAATWMPPGAKESYGFRDTVRQLPFWLRASTPLRAFHVVRSFVRTERLQPKEPHYYLGSVGVHPDFQGQGLGSALIESMMPRIDAEGVPSYLVSSNERNLPLYERYGYRVRDEIQLPHGGPTLWPMYRDPTA